MALGRDEQRHFEIDGPAAFEIDGPVAEFFTGL